MRTARGGGWLPGQNVCCWWPAAWCRMRRWLCWWLPSRMHSPPVHGMQHLDMHTRRRIRIWQLPGSHWHMQGVPLAGVTALLRTTYMCSPKTVWYVATAQVRHGDGGNAVHQPDKRAQGVAHLSEDSARTNNSGARSPQAEARVTSHCYNTANQGTAIGLI